MDVLDIFKRRTRSPKRPRSSDVIRSIFPHFRQHPPYSGSLILGEADQWDRHIYIVGQQKPKPEDFRTAKDLKKLNFGMLTADEHSLILRFLNQVNQNGADDAVVISFVDTYGADISMESARNFQAFFISHVIRTYLTLPAPTISVVLGEGGSGGALAVQFADRRAQMDDALYATAPPESMAAIIFRDPSRVQEALAILKPTAHELKNFNIIDHIIPAPHDVTDVEGFARPLSDYLERTVKELSKIKIAKLQEERIALAEGFGSAQLIKPKRRFWHFTPLLKKTSTEKPLDLKVVISPDDSAIQVYGDYGDGIIEERQECVRCGDINENGETEDGCGTLIPLQEYLANHRVCPNCGASRVMGALGWINCLSDEESFHELYRDLTVQDLLPESFLTPEYKKFLEKQIRRTHFRESLVTGEARIYGHPVMMAVCDFYFSGGTMGVVFGEKFNRAVDYAIERKLPFISLCCSGGARLYEGTPALMQMVKTIAAVEKLKNNHLPYISILGDPSTGGAIASYAALGDVIISEPDAMVIFTGPRVMASRGFPVQEELIRARSLSQLSSELFARRDYFQGIRGIHEVAERKDMKRVMCKYLEFYLKSCGRVHRKDAKGK